MYGKRKINRIYAKYLAARYAGRKSRSRKKRRQIVLSVVLLLTGVGVLYGKKPPVLCFSKQWYEKMAKLINKGHRSGKEEETLLVRYVNAPGGYLAISHASGNVPVYAEPEKKEETELISVRDVLEERFGDLEHVDFKSFLSNYYIEDVSTRATEDIFQIENLLKYDLTIKKTDEPQILIFHTHASEGYADSRPGVMEDTVVGAGEILANELRNKYGYQVIHEKTVFDRKKDGTDDRNNAYNNALPVVTSILEKYPSIEVVIDLHIDSGDARTSVINGVNTAKIMLFNGLCRTKDGPISYYSNKNLQGNLAFSLNLQITGNELYPGLMHRIYLKSYRYNMHLKEKYLLVELGTHKNTVEEAKAAMAPFAKALAAVLSEKE